MCDLLLLFFAVAAPRLLPVISQTYSSHLMPHVLVLALDRMH
jgi:hypothetical protein